MPTKPERNAARALPVRLATSAPANAKLPGTAHSPGSAARSKTKVSDGSSRMVRRSLTPAVLPLPDRARTGSPVRPPAACRSGSVLPRQRTSRSPWAVEGRDGPFLEPQAIEIGPGDGCHLVLAPGVEASIRWRAKLSTNRPEPISSKPSSAERRRQRPQARLVLADATRGEWWRRTRANPDGCLGRASQARPAGRRRSGRHRCRWRPASRISIGRSGGACATSASRSATMPT